MKKITAFIIPKDEFMYMPPYVRNRCLIFKTDEGTIVVDVRNLFDWMSYGLKGDTQ